MDPFKNIRCYLLEIANGHKTSRWSNHLLCSETMLLQTVHSPSLKQWAGLGGWEGWRGMIQCHRRRDSSSHSSTSPLVTTDLLSASMFVKSPAEFIPIQDESSNFGHVAGKHCLHA